MKVFINNADDYFENVLCEFLNTKQNELMGTSTDNNTTPQYISKFLAKKEDILKPALLEADVIVFRIKQDIEEAKFAIKLLENSQYNNHKVFILISSVISWAKTKREYIEEEPQDADNADDKDNDDDDSDADDVDAVPVEQVLNDAPVFKRKDYEPLKEDAVVNRKPHDNYKNFLEIEKRVKKANCSTLKTFVVFSGVMYGRGEDMLHQFFKQAWMGDVPRLPCFLDGGNYVPLIHVDDIASLVSYVIKTSFPEEPDQEPEELEQYLLAIDSSQLKFKDLMVSISTVFHGPEVLQPVTEQELVQYEYTDHLTSDLKFQPGVASGWEVALKFQEGIVANIKKIRAEYEKKRNLSPLRLAVLGPPVAGKSTIAQQLASHYKIEYIGLTQVVKGYVDKEKQLEDGLFELDKEKILLKREKERIKQEKAKLRQDKLDAIEKRKQEREARIQQKEAAREERERIRQEKIDSGVDVDDEDEDPEDSEEEEPEDEEIEPEEEDEEQEEEQEEEEVDETSPVSVLKKQIAELKKITGLKDTDGRFKDEALSEMIRNALTSRVCRNQGWILDGFPKTVTQAKLLVLQPTASSEDGEGDEEEAEEEPEDPSADDDETTKDEDERSKGKKAHPDFMPEYVMVLDAEETLLEKRSKSISKPTTGHNDNDGMKRRLTTYQANNTAENSVAGCLEGMVTAKKHGSIQPITKHIAIAENSDVESIVNICVDFVGEPHNYGPSQEELDVIARQIEEERRKEEQRIENERQMKLQKEKVEIEERERVKRRDYERLEEIKKQERDLLEIKSQPLRLFLMDTMIPVLTKGLIDVVQVKPQDPIDYLAEWLFRYAENEE